MVKIMVEVEIPDYSVKFCDDIYNGKRCRYLQRYNYGTKCYCMISNKEITKTKNNGNKVCRPYGCRCKTKSV